MVTFLNHHRIYLLFLVWGLVFLIGLIFPTTSLTLLVGFLFLLFLPGFSFSRILKISVAGDVFSTWMIYLTTGFVFNLLMCFMAILIHANITILAMAYSISLPLLLMLAFVLDFRRREQESTAFSWKDIFKLENLIYLILITLIILILFVLNIKGANFAGDPTFHLAVMRKVVEGNPFSVGALAFLKNQPQPVYAYLIWQTFLGFLSHIFHLNIFTLWNEIPIGLTVIVVLAWAWVFKKIFQQNYLIVLALIIFLIFHLANQAYLFTRIPIPDAIAKLFVLPLSLALAFQYIFGKTHDWKILTLNVLLLVLAAFVHLTQYIYFFFMLGSFGLIYTLGFWREENYKKIIQRILILTGLSLVPVVLLLLALQPIYNIVGENMAWFATVQLVLIYGHFSDYDTPTQIAFIFLPLTALFWRKNPKILFLLVIMLIAPVIYYIAPLREFLSQKLSFVFVRRMFSNVVWYFAIWALLTGFIIIIFDRLMAFLAAQRPRLKLIINVAVGLIVILLLGLETQYQWLARLHEAVFSKHASRYLEANFVWLIILISILVIIGLVIQKYFAPLRDFFANSRPQNPLLVFLIILTFSFWLITDARPFLVKNFVSEIKSQKFLRPAPDITTQIAQAEDIGGPAVLNFIKENLPTRAIFETNTGYRDLPELLDVYVAALPDHAPPEKELSRLYETQNVPIDDKLTCLGWYKVDYLLINAASSKIIEMGFPDLSQYLAQVYPPNIKVTAADDEISVIYKVDWGKIKADYPLANAKNPPPCRAERYQ